MPRPKGAGKGATEVIGLRLEKEVVAYYRTKANEAGLSLSQFLKQTLMVGLAAESFEKIEERLQAIASSVPSAEMGKSTLPEEAWKSMFLTEALVTRIVESRNPQDLYDAQLEANKKVQALKGL